MADNVPITSGSGINIAADDISSVLFQRVKLIHGADGTNDGDVASDNPLPVVVSSGTITSLPAITGSVTVVNDPIGVTGSVAAISIPAITGSVAVISQPAVTGSVAVVGDVTVDSITNAVTVTGSTAVVGDVTVDSVTGTVTVTGSVAAVTIPAITGSVSLVGTSAVTGSVTVIGVPETTITGSVAAISIPAITGSVNVVNSELTVTGSVEAINNLKTGRFSASTHVTDATTAVDVVAASGGAASYISSYLISAYTFSTVWLEDGSGNQLTAYHYLADNGGASYTAAEGEPIVTTITNTTIAIKSTAAGSVSCLIVGWQE